MEVIGLLSNDGKGTVNFLKRNILTHFGTPRTIISNKSSHFGNWMFGVLLGNYRVKHCMKIPYHPHANKYVKLSHREIKAILAKMVKTNGLLLCKTVLNFIYDNSIHGN